MKDDIECPYCKVEQEIDHDEGYGYEEGELYEQYCYACEKTFTYTTYITYSYDVYEAPCLNGGEHDWQKIVGLPKEFHRDSAQCTHCEKRKIVKETISGVAE